MSESDESWGVRLTLGAERDLDGLATWLEEERVGEGRRFLRALNEVIGRIGHFPRSGTGDGQGGRRAHVAKYHVTVYYMVDEPGRRVVIDAILHQRRHPPA